MWYGMDDDDTGTRADNPILVVAESVAMVSRMPLADLQVREAAEIIATESDEKAGVETSVETDEAKDVESDEHQDPATNESQQDTLGDTVRTTLGLVDLRRVDRRLGQFGMLRAISLLRHLTNDNDNDNGASSERSGRYCSLGQQEASAEADDDTVSLEEVMGSGAEINEAHQEAVVMDMVPPPTEMSINDGLAAEETMINVAVAEAEVEMQRAAAGGGEEATAVRLRLRQMGSLKRPRQCGTPGCVRTDHHPGPCTGQQVLGPRQRRPSARVLVEHETDADATEEQVAAESDDKAPPTEMPMLGPRRRKKQPPLPGWRVVRYAAPTGRDERHFKHIQTGRYARGATQMWRMEEELRGGRWSGCQIFPANTSERTREEESSCGCGCGSTRDLASEEHAAAATPQAADHDDDGDSSDDWEPGSRSRSMQGSQRKHPRRGEASSPASEASEASCTLCAWDDDEKGNEILLCDGCDAAFHQKCVAAWYKVQPSRAALCSSHPISTRSQTGALTATAPYPGACPRLSTACLRARGSAPLA